MRWIAFCAACCGLLVGQTALQAENRFPERYLTVEPQSLELIQPGVVVDRHAEYGWSDLVTIVHPRLGSGAVDSIPDFAGRYASMFKFTMLANVKQAPVDGKPQYWLDRLGIGFAMEVDGNMTILTKSTAKQLGAELGMIERGVLGGNEDCLKDVVQIARTERLVMFDVKANMLNQNVHRMMTLRHLIWVSPNTGKLGMLVWLLDDGDEDDGDYKLAEEQMQLLPPGYQEDRVIHVSEGGLFSRIPTPDRFALVSVPPGTPVPFSDSMRAVAARKTFDREDMQHLVVGVGQSIAGLKARVAQNRQ